MSEELKETKSQISTNMLDKLSPQERELALSILKEMNDNNGESKKFANLLYADYKEIPVDIETFLRDDNYLGKAWKDVVGNFKLYPFWLEEVLKKIFPTNVDTDYDTLLESGARGIGKAQPLDADVLTDAGFKKMRDIHYGDKVFGNDGKLHNVIGVFPQGIKNVCKITFNDNTSTLCCDEHLWTICDTRSKNHKWVTVETKDILSKQIKNTSRNFNEHRYKIPLTSPILFKHKNVDIPAYTLGVLLGDGSLTRGRVCFTSFDDEIVNNVVNELPNDLQINCLSADKRFYSITKKDKYLSEFNYISNVPIRCESKYLHYLREKCLDTTSDLKYIPEEYLYNDVETRLSLLQGLLDTDGYISKDGSHISFSTSSEKLATNVKFIVESLGGVCRIHLKDTSYRNKKTNNLVSCKKSYIVYIKLDNNICPFRLTRKKDRLNINSHSPSRYIDSIEYIGKDECQCILLDSEEHLYLTNNFIVTHNSEVACGCVGAYLMYRVMCMKNPLEYYRLKPTEKICFAFMNIKLDLAEEIAISKFQKTIQMSPWFTARCKMTQRNNQAYLVPPEPINIIIGSQADDVIGKPIYYAFFDEISFIRNQDIDKQKQKAKDMIDTAIGGMLTRFIHNGKNPTMLVVASSKRSEQSFMEEYIRLLQKNEGNKVLVVDKPVWEVKPQGTYGEGTFYLGLGNKFLESVVIPESDYDKLDLYKEKGYKILTVPTFFKAKFLEDMERNLCDIAGISSSSLSKYMNAQMVSDCINHDFHNPLPDIIECGNGKEDTTQYYNYFDLTKFPKSLISQPLFIHLDMSISGDMTGIAGVCITGKKPSTDATQQARDLQFRLVFSTSIKAPKGRQISFEKNRNFIRWLRDSGFNVKKVTSDTFQAYDLQQQLKAEGFDCEMLSVDRVDTDHICKPYQYLKNTIYEKRFEMYKSERLFDEFIDVERNINTGKVDHTPNGHKDCLDAVCGATFTASKMAEEYAFDYGESLDVITENNLDNANLKQMTVNFEEELMKMYNPLGQNSQSQQNSEHKSVIEKPQEVNHPFVSDGMIIW